MQSLTLVLGTIIPVFLIILVGYIIGKKKQVDTQIITDILVYIAAPCLTFTSISRSQLNPRDLSSIFFAAAIIIIVQATLFFLAIRIRKSQKIGLFLPAVIGNTGYLGYPVALFAFGAVGLSSAIAFDVIGSLFLFSIGIWIVHNKNEFTEIFRIPLIYAVVLGIIFNIFSLKIPDIVFKPLEMIGAITIPLALLLLGYKLTKIKLQSVNISLFVSVFKIFGGLVIAVLIVSLLNISGVSRNIILLQAAMPSAVMSMILANKYGRDSQIVASVVFISTVISIFTIPIILYFIA